MDASTTCGGAARAKLLAQSIPIRFKKRALGGEDPAYQATREAFMVFVTARVRRRIVLVGDSLGSGL